MKIAFSILTVAFLMPGNLGAAPAKNEAVLSVHFDKDDLKSKEPYPVVANLVIDKNFDAILSYGGGVMSDYRYTLDPGETRDLKSLLDKYAVYESAENQAGNVHRFDGRGKSPVAKKALTEIEAFGLRITAKILKGLK